MVFQDEIEAAKYLLKDSTSDLLNHNVDFVVVGGWSPFLFHRKKYGHPGTFDVDILLHSDSLENGTFDKASESLLSKGYLRAPKNIFQAHRVLQVTGEELVFHIDFLNEQDPGNALELVGGTGRMKSIYTESMKAVFKYNNYRSHNDYLGVRFPSPETFVVTKAAAAIVKKRKRDAFDIFVTVSDQDPNSFKKIWKNLCDGDGLFSDANDALRDSVENGDAIEKVQAVLKDMQVEKLLTVAMPSESEITNTFSFLNT